jgi:hypothetical protein
MTAFPIIAELDNDRCAALGIIGRGEAPALDLCRKLIELGVDPAAPLHVYRRPTLSLVVRTIDEGAKLVVKANHQGTPVFQRHAPGPATAPPVAPNDRGATPAPTPPANAPCGVGP